MNTSPVQLKEKLLKALDEDQNVRFDGYYCHFWDFVVCLNMSTITCVKKIRTDVKMLSLFQYVASLSLHLYFFTKLYASKLRFKQIYQPVHSIVFRKIH